MLGASGSTFFSLSTEHIKIGYNHYLLKNHGHNIIPIQDKVSPLISFYIMGMLLETDKTSWNDDFYRTKPLFIVPGVVLGFQEVAGLLALPRVGQGARLNGLAVHFRSVFIFQGTNSNIKHAATYP